MAKRPHPKGEEEGKKHLKGKVSEERRQELSRQARERIARGEMGGAEFGKLGGRPRKKDRAARRVAEAAQQDANAQAIINVFKDAVHPNQPMGIRMKGAQAWVQIENEETKLALQEEENTAKNQSREELVAILAQKLTSGTTAAILKKQLEEGDAIVDAEVVDE